MNPFIKYLSEAKITERNDNIKNWKDIVNKFDVIEDAILQPNGKSIRVRGKKDGKFADVYTDYKNSAVAKEVLKRVEAFIGIKESELDEAFVKDRDYKYIDDVIITTKSKFKSAHKDYKGGTTTKPTYLVMTDKGTVSAPIKFIDNDEFEDIMNEAIKIDDIEAILGKGVPHGRYTKYVLKDKSYVLFHRTFGLEYRAKDDSLLPHQWKTVKAMKKELVMGGMLNEAAVGQKGRTSYKEAMDYCEENEELVDEFRKIIKKLGGKTVAKALLDKLSQKPEIKDEIEHIEDIIDNSNY